MNIFLKLCNFSNFISMHSLVDIPLEGGQYTWFNSSLGEALS